MQKVLHVDTCIKLNCTGKLIQRYLQNRNIADHNHIKCCTFVRRIKVKITQTTRLDKNVKI